MEEWPSRNLICSIFPPFLRQSLAQVRRRSCAPKRSMPISRADCSTTDQTAQPLMLSLTLPPLDTARRSLQVRRAMRLDPLPRPFLSRHGRLLDFIGICRSVGDAGFGKHVVGGGSEKDFDHSE